ncbi:hypothetical protein MSPP1_004037 [Malassezia sp. CBS 17886]|nr:hypothetical protein MSPP1_004037 [Malassezia sp. CBS 17886]
MRIPLVPGETALRQEGSCSTSVDGARHEQGVVTLTTQRLLVPGSGRHEGDILSIPLERLGSVQYKIPIFSAPYLTADMAPSLDGAHDSITIQFRGCGGVPFYDALLRTRAQWLIDRRAEEPLRAWLPRSV